MRLPAELLLHRPSPGRAFLAIGTPLALACLTLVMAGGCAKKAAARAPRAPVMVARAVTRGMPYAIDATGSVEAIQTAQVGSQVGGTVTRVMFHEGDEVRDGQVLFQLDPRPFRATLAQSQAQYDRDRAQAQVARLEAERAEKLVEKNVLSQSDYDQKKAAAETWEATLSADSASVSAAALNLAYCSVRAPIAGKTGRLNVHDGDYVKAASSDPLVTINQVRPVRVAFPVPVTVVPEVQRYRSQNPIVIVRPPGSDSAGVQGRLVFVDNAVDPRSGTLLLKGEFPNADGRLVPGQYVDVRLELYRDANAIVVPAVSITRGQQGAYVYVVNPDSTVAPRSITVGRTVDEFAVVMNGLKPGETVVTDGQLRLSPGARVLVRNGPDHTP